MHGGGRFAKRVAAVASCVVAIALITIAFRRALEAEPVSGDPWYLSPGEIAVSADRRWLYVVCERSHELRIVDARSNSVVKSVEVGCVPRGLALSPDGRQIYVTNSWDDNVTVIDAATLSLLSKLPAGWEPTSVVTDQGGKTLYVANRLSDDISVIDLVNGRESKRLPAGRGASYLVRSADGARIYCTHVYPNPGSLRQPPKSEITAIDSSQQTVIERYALHNVAGVFHVALSSDGRLGVAAQLRPKNLIPLAHVEQGWVFGNSLTVFGADAGGAIQVPIDELDRYFVMPFAVAITPDKSKIYVSTSGSDSVTVISVPELLKFTSMGRESMANDLCASANYVIAARRRGEQIFYSARYAFQGQFGCANCHIDATLDGLQWDLEPDGFGKDIVDNRSIEDLSGTEPFKWNGRNPDLTTECGPRTERYFYRSQSYNPQELTDLVSFVLSIPLRPNRYRLPGAQLTLAQARGKAIFERTRYKSGRPIPRHNQCAYCHRGPKFTNQKLAYVGTARTFDNSEMLDVPHLTNDAYSAPYLHDGSAATLEELWTIFNPNDAHGVTSDLDADEIHDLVEYLKSL